MSNKKDEMDELIKKKIKEVLPDYKLTQELFRRKGYQCLLGIVPQPEEDEICFEPKQTETEKHAELESAQTSSTFEESHCSSPKNIKLDSKPTASCKSKNKEKEVKNTQRRRKGQKVKSFEKKPSNEDKKV